MSSDGDRPDVELGVVGLTEGNGHPYSFASIVNGYSRSGFADSGWEVILEYLEEKDDADFGFPGVEVTHAWTQDPAETERLCAAARVPTAADDLDDLVGLDGVLLLRDDHENHLEMARPFLEAGTPTFVDKPLALDVEELAAFEPYLREGLVTSCSGMRYAVELDGPRARPDEYGDLRLVRGTVLNDWERYGIHVLEAILGVVPTRPVAVTTTPAGDGSFVVETAEGYPIQVDALGDAPLVLDVDVYGRDRTSHHELRDNFRAFRRTIYHFVDAVRTGEPPIPPEETLDVLRVLVAGRRARREGRRVTLDEIGI
jgi:predicted dehydrogenase